MVYICYFTYSAGPGTQLITCKISFIWMDGNCSNFSNQNWDKNVTLCILVALNQDTAKMNYVKLSTLYQKEIFGKNYNFTNIYV